MGWRSLKVLYLDLDLALRSGYVIVIDIDTDLLLLMYIDWRNCCMGKWCTGQAEYSIGVLNYSPTNYWFLHLNLQNIRGTVGTRFCSWSHDRHCMRAGAPKLERTRHIA